MTSSKNNITGDNLISKTTTPEYYNGWEMIWGKNSGSTVGRFQITDKLIDDISRPGNCKDCAGQCHKCINEE
jgi:hypothetical protein